MRLDNLPFPVFGNIEFRGKCPLEKVEQVSVVNRIRSTYPDTWGLLLTHIRNEGISDKLQHNVAMKHRAEGMVKGACDLIIPAARTFCCEIKRCDPNLSKLDKDQVKYLTAAHNAGAFACVALGAVGAWAAFETWLGLQHHN
jgi:hypothetical protein